MPTARPIQAIPITASGIAARGVGAGTLSPMAAAILPLFGNSTPGAWFDPSDFSTMFQDAAGTTPVTALGQPVGKILDKSPRGNHATCPGATTSRPTIQARVNRFLASEDLSDASWSKAGCTISPNSAGTYDKIVESAGGTFHNIASSNLGAGVSQVVSFSASAAGRSWVWCQLGLQKAYFNVQTGQLGVVGAGLTASIYEDPEGGYRCTVTASSPASTTFVLGVGSANGTANYSGDGSSGVNVGKMQIAFSDDPFKDVYQKVVTATNYTDIGAPRYLSFDGTDDWLETAAIDMTATDSVVAIAGFRKNSDAAAGVVFEFSPTVASNNSSFHILAPVGASPSIVFRSRGTGIAQADATTGYAAPLTCVATGIGDISSDTAILRVNGTQAATSTSDQGTGNYGNYKLYIGRRGGATSALNGRLYGLVIVGASQSNAVINTVERFMGMKTGVSW